MPLPTSSLAKICNEIREHIETYTPTLPDEWNVIVTIGAPGANLAANNTDNTLNLFFYRFEPFSFAADALPSDVQWVKVFCVITAFGVDEDTDNDTVVDFSAGFNELRMLSQVMRMFQEQPVMLIEGSDSGELWHTQFIPRPLADEQINQIWSTQGDTIYRPSVVYEIALAPIEPEKSAQQTARVSSVGTHVGSDMSNRHSSWPTDRGTLFYPPSSITVDTSNPQWAPAVVMVSGAADDRQAHLTLKLDVNSAGNVVIPDIDIWIAGDTSKDVSVIGQLLQNGQWQDIDAHDNLKADVETLDMVALPNTTSFTLQQSGWTSFDQAETSWQLQLFAERYIAFDSQTGRWNDTSVENAEVRIRSNPVLITVVREAP